MPLLVCTFFLLAAYLIILENSFVISSHDKFDLSEFDGDLINVTLPHLSIHGFTHSSHHHHEEPYNRTKHAHFIYADESFRSNLRKYGVVHIPGAIHSDLLHKALYRMNFDVGQFHKDLHYEGAARAGYTVNTSDVLNLHYKSVLPNLLELVLGPKEYSPFSGFSQVPIRFPGDLCDGDERGFDPIYERQNWHIDSIARIEGIGHATEIKNFDTTIVILLSDTHGKNSGELATFPGSHLILSSLFRRDKQLIQQLKADGLAALPRHEKSDAILGTKPYHCLGKVGDMFILNYMNAHFPTCNLSPYIRYAAFFRFTGPAFPPDSVPHEERPESMFNPLIHWRI